MSAVTAATCADNIDLIIRWRNSPVWRSKYSRYVSVPASFSTVRMPRTTIAWEMLSIGLFDRL